MVLKTKVLAVTLFAGFAATLGGIAPASAEFFGCNDPHPHRLLYSSTQSYSVPSHRQTRRSSFDFSDRRTRHTSYHANYSERGSRRVADRWR
jgi:hypothetical protein